ncbi:MAG: YkgJ family cysteine cluster protein, partial [Candidatus Latescibacteria bacterium]|nr:YkgJ family cysteine cluster protein [Candidatus Latescibacterota bacterium]
MSKRRFWHQGLKFQCHQCGNCCTGPPGYVWFTDDELHQMAAFAHITPDQFRDLYAHKVGRR